MHGARDLRIETRPLDANELEPDELYVETQVTALSTGTDLGNYLGDSTYVPDAPGYPRTVGYSNVGVIWRVGSAVRRFVPGQRIFSTRPHQSAYVARENDLLVSIPAEVSSEVASLAYFTHLGLASLRQARYLPGENVAIVGLGVIGLCTVSLASAMGAKVAAIGNSIHRMDLALKVGADFVCTSDDPKIKQRWEKLGETGVDIVVLTANSWDAYRLSLELVRHSGRVCLLGFPGRGQDPPAFNPLHPQWIYAKQLAIYGSGYAPEVDYPSQDVRFNTRRNLQYIFDLMATGKLDLSALISHRLPALRMQEAYELAATHTKELVTAIFNWEGME